MKKYTFDSREEAINFLDKHNFKYYIPRVDEYMSNIKDDFKSYYIEVSDLGEITGDTATEDILNTIFSKFCLGK